MGCCVVQLLVWYGMLGRLEGDGGYIDVFHV